MPWLAVVANITKQPTCRVPSASQSTKKSTKAGNDVEYKSENRHEIPIKDFTGLAKNVAKSPKWQAHIPLSIIGLLSEVISLRKEVTSWLGLRCSVSEGQNESHRYFITVLEQVRDILQPQIDLPNENGIKSSKGDSRLERLPNIFDALTMEESKMKSGLSMKV